MDCHKAQAQLEFTTPGREAAGGPEAIAARHHVAECDACHLALESQQRFDTEIARAMSNVPIPPGLNERLAAAINAATAPAETAARPESTGRPSATARPASTVRPVSNGSVPTPRRRFVRSLGWGVVAALAPLLIWGLLAQRVPPLNEANVRELAGLDLNSLPVASDQAAFSPADWNSLRAIQLGDAPRRATVNGTKVPVMSFQVQTSRRSPPATGFLVRLPKSQWHAEPDTTSFSSATIQYASFGTWVVWLEGDEVYLCILHDNAHAMQSLQKLIAGSRELT